MTQAKSSMLAALQSKGPAPDRAEQLMLYGQFVGAWEGFVRVHTPNGSQDVSCEVHFDWVLDGRAIQDVWIAPSRNDRHGTLPPNNLYGSTIRVYDPQQDLWYITWINPVTQAFNRMTGKQIGDDIIQEYITDAGAYCQWCFTEITDASFHWVNRESTDNGITWNIKSEFFLNRKLANDKA